MNKSILILIINLILIIVQLVNCDYLEYRKVHLVDKIVTNNGNVNYLFRGNEPKVRVNDTDYFGYQELLNCMINNTNSLGDKMPTQFSIIDIKLIYGWREEDGDIELESTFFNANPQYGEFNTNITLGDLMDPILVPEEELEKWAITLDQWQHDKLPSRIQLYRDIVNREEQLPTVLYIHCECGCDRTGEVFASYAMKYLGYSFREAMEWDYKIAGRRIMLNHQIAAQWYCYYLKFAEKMDIDCTGPIW